MTRWKAGGIHFTISVVIATALIASMLALWYPPPYFSVMGGATLILLIVGCDVVLGPLMTTVIYRKDKKGLVLDLAIIAFLQTAALTYGLYMMFEARPVFTVFAVDRFEVVAANQIRREELARAKVPAFATLPLTGPLIVGAVLPTDPKEQFAVAMGAMSGGEDIKNLPRLYVAYDSIAASAAGRARPLKELVMRPDVRTEIQEKLHNQGSLEHYGYLPLVGRFRSISVIVDNRTGQIRAMIDAPPALNGAAS